jgi:hypothetical protein
MNNRFDNLFAQAQLHQGICANNINEYISQTQYGGKCMLAVGHLSSMVTTTGVEMLV